MAATKQDFEVWAGDHADLVFTVTDEETVLETTVRWKMAETVNSDPLIVKNGASITLSGNTFTVHLDPEDTRSVEASARHYNGKKYYHEAEVRDADNKVFTVSTGEVTLWNTIIKSEP